MDLGRLQQIYRSVDNRLYDFYRNSMYHMQEHPSMFWITALLAVYGLVRVAL